MQFDEKICDAQYGKTLDDIEILDEQFWMVLDKKPIFLKGKENWTEQRGKRI